MQNDHDEVPRKTLTPEDIGDFNPDREDLKQLSCLTKIIKLNARERTMLKDAYEERKQATRESWLAML